VSQGTKLIENNPEEIVEEISQMTANSNELATCLPSGGMQYSYNYFFEIKKKLLEKHKKGQHRGIRYVTAIDKENIHLIKVYLQSGIQVRHSRNLPPLSFGVSDKQIAATIEKMEGGRNVQSLQRLSNDILDVTKIESQTLRLIKERVDTNEIILSVVNDFRNQIRNPDRLIISFSKTGSIYIEADRLRLYQVMANLLSNAIK
jgi:signal transduction histidine kinase